MGVGYCAMGGVCLRIWLCFGGGQAASTLMWVQVFVQLPVQSLQGGLCSLLYADPAACCADSLPAMQQVRRFQGWHFRRYHLASCFLRSPNCLSCGLHVQTCTLRAKSVADCMLGPPALLFHLMDSVCWVSLHRLDTFSP